MTENDSNWNWLKSCSESYTISNSESNCIWLEYCNQCLADKSGKFLMRGWPSRMGRHWRLIIIFWLAHWNIDFECQTISHANIFSRRLMFYISTATGNYSIWNRLKSFTYPYAFSDFKSHFLSPEYCNQCLADKTDHLEWKARASWSLHSDWAPVLLILNIRHKHYLTKTNVWYTQSHWKLLLI